MNVCRHLLRSLGEAGEIEPETDGILIEYNIDTSDFSQEVIHNINYGCNLKNLSDIIIIIKHLVCHMSIIKQ